jgi:hypothetical protein
MGVLDEFRRRMNLPSEFQRKNIAAMPGDHLSQYEPTTEEHTTDWLRRIGVPRPAAESVGNFVGTLAGGPFDARRAAEQGNYQEAAMLMMPGAGPAGRLAKKVEIEAWHGGPTAFARFLDKYRTTGEGSASRGMGHYAGEERKVGETYRDVLSGGPTLGGRSIYPSTPWVSHPARRWAGQALTEATQAGAIGDDAVKMAIEKLNSVGKKIPGIVGEQHLRAAERLPVLFGKDYDLGKGYLYQLGIDAHPDHFLNWDTALEKQSSYVKDQLGKTDWWKNTLDKLEATAPSAGPKGGDLSELLSKERTPMGATQTLKDAGISGTKFWDQTSRKRQTGTSNYVIFDPRNIRIKQRIGILSGLLGANAAVGAVTTDTKKKNGGI